MRFGDITDVSRRETSDIWVTLRRVGKKRGGYLVLVGGGGRKRASLRELLRRLMEPNNVSAWFVIAKRVELHLRFAVRLRGATAATDAQTGARDVARAER